MAALTNNMGPQRVEMTEEERQKIEELKRMGNQEEIVLRSLDETQQYVPPLLREFLINNKMRIAASWNAESESLQSECPEHPRFLDTGAVNPENVLNGSLEAAINALAPVLLDIFLLAMGIMGFPSLNVPTMAFMRNLNKVKLVECYDTETLLARLRKIKRWRNDFSLFEQLCLLIAEFKGFYNAFTAVVDAMYAAVISKPFSLFMAIACIIAQLFVWATTGGAQIIASIFLVLSAFLDLKKDVKKAIDAWEAYLAL